MRAVIQRVQSALVTIEGKKTVSIGKGLLVFLGVTHEDTAAQSDLLAQKCADLRIFEDGEGKMNLSTRDVAGEMLIVSQFTLYGDCKKGNRPSFIEAARPETAIPLYERFIEEIRRRGIPTGTGEFGADMKVSLLNDGPVTILMDTEEMKRKG